MFDWLRRKLKGRELPKTGLVHVRGQRRERADPVLASALASQEAPMVGVALLGRRVELKLPWPHPVPFISYVYVDPSAVLSAKGDRAEVESLATTPTVTEYLSERARWQVQPCNRCGMVDSLDPPSVTTRNPSGASCCRCARRSTSRSWPTPGSA